MNAGVEVGAPRRTDAAQTVAIGLPKIARETYGLAAIVILGLGASLSDGYYTPVALALVVVGLGLILLLIRSGTTSRAASLCWSVAALLGAIVTAYLYHGSLLVWLVSVVAGGLAATVVLCRQTARRRAAAALSAAIGLTLLGVSVQWGAVSNDVFWFIQGATAHLLVGVNPYAASYLTYIPGLASSHFPYGPGVLLLSVPGRLLGDVRVSDLLAVLVMVAAVVALARREGGSEQGWRCLALCLTLPFLPRMITLAWAEVYLAAAIPVWLCWRERHPWAAVAVLGLGLSTVPTALPLLALPFLWWARARREILAAGLIALAICLPFVVWAGPLHFLADTAGLQLRLPPLAGGLDFDAAWVRLTQTWLPGWLWPLLTVAVLLAFVQFRERTWSTAFFLGTGLLAVSLLFAKWAFFNYYFLVAVGLILGIALMSRSAPAHARPGELAGYEG